MKDKLGTGKHEFALFVESLSSQISTKSEQILIISDEQLVHRIRHVLRLQLGDGCIVFDRHTHALATIEAFVGKKQIQLLIKSIKKTLSLQPKITFLLPLLKRDDYQAALYSLAEVGVNEIQLIFTQKTSQQWSESKDYERAQRIIIGAVEQSKNFAYPEIKSPVHLEVALKQYSSATKIFFDPEGKHCFDVFKQLYENKAEHILLLIGPEGDLTIDEKKMVQASGFVFSVLTPTVVRAVQAAALGAGFVRSILASNAN